MIAAANWRKYINKLTAIDKMAAFKMQSFINKNGLEDGEALIQYAYELIKKYGETSATLACQMYDYMAEIMGAEVAEAIPADIVSLKEVAKGVTWGKYHSPSQIPSTIGRMVRQAGADTMIQNAKRDGAEWAWVPQGDTCAFCIMLASRGWQNASKTVLKGNHAEHIHQNCNCTFAIAFKPKDRKQYDYIYDPGKYEDMYYNADGDINELRRQIDASRIGGKRIKEKTLYYQKTGGLSPAEYKRAKELWKRVKELDIPQSEREYVYEQFDEWLTAEEKQSAIVCRPIGNYYYQAVHLGHNEYKIYGKKPIGPYSDWLDEIMTEVIGSDWRKYDL